MKTRALTRGSHGAPNPDFKPRLLPRGQQVSQQLSGAGEAQTTKGLSCHRVTSAVMVQKRGGEALSLIEQGRLLLGNRDPRRHIGCREPEDGGFPTERRAACRAQRPAPSVERHHCLKHGRTDNLWSLGHGSGRHLLDNERSQSLTSRATDCVSCQ